MGQIWEGPSTMYLCACRRRSCHTRITKEIKLRQWLAVDDSQGNILGDRKLHILKCKPHRALSGIGQQSRLGTFTNCTDRGWRGGTGYGRISDGGKTGELTFSVWWSSVWVEQCSLEAVVGFQGPGGSCGQWGKRQEACVCGTVTVPSPPSP